VASDQEGTMDWRGWQLSTLLRAVQGRRVPPAPIGGPSGPRARRSAPTAGDRALDTLLDDLDPVRRRQVLAPLGGGGAGGVRPARAGRLLRWGSAAAQQVDGTTCGAAVLGMLAAAGDPRLAAWLVTGRTPVGGSVPPELRLVDAGDLVTAHDPIEAEAGSGTHAHEGDGGAAPDGTAGPGGAAGPIAGHRTAVGHHPDAPTWFRTPDGRTVHADATPEAATAARWGALQHALHRASTRRAVLGLLPWPRALGTPPWGAERLARFPGVRYRAVPVDDRRPAEVQDLLVRIDAALDHGVPVPLYSGGDLGDGLAAAVPRHVVLAAARTDDGYLVYEPGAGRLLPLTRGEVERPTGPAAALGGWTHLCWALLPVADRGR
jgi:hypothetical protein